MERDFDDDNYSDLEDLNFDDHDVVSNDEGFPEEEISPIDDPLSSIPD